MYSFIYYFLCAFFSFLFLIFPCLFHSCVLVCYFPCFLSSSHVSTVGIVTRIRSGRPTNLRSIPGGGKNFFPFWSVTIGSRSQPVSYLLLTGAKAAVACSITLIPSSAEFKNDWSCIDMPPCCAHWQPVIFSPSVVSCTASQQCRFHVCSVMRYTPGRKAATHLFCCCGLFTAAHCPYYSQPPQLIERPLFTSLSAPFR